MDCFVSARFGKFVLILCFSVHVVCKEDIICSGPWFSTVDRWVYWNGSLSADIDVLSKLDYAMNENALEDMAVLLAEAPEETISSIKYLSLANNGFDRIPAGIWTGGEKIRVLTENLQYLTFKDNDLSGKSYERTQNSNSYDVALHARGWTPISPKMMPFLNEEAMPPLNWASELANANFSRLRELDLRNCSIERLQHRTFAMMKNLQYLYLHGNRINRIDSSAFFSLSNLLHLDLSFNSVYADRQNAFPASEGLSLVSGVFKPLQKLRSLDLSNTRIVMSSSRVFCDLGKTVKRLSLCHTNLLHLSGILENSQLRFLDISHNVGILDLNFNSFDGYEYSLEVLYAKKLSVNHLSTFSKLTNLRVLSISGNNIVNFDRAVLNELTNLTILEIDDNRISSWIDEQPLQNLRVLTMRNNNLNLMSKAMLKDFSRIEYLAIGQNEFVCSCFLRHFMDMAVRNLETYEMRPHMDYIIGRNSSEIDEDYDIVYGGILALYRRKIVKQLQSKPLSNDPKEDTEFDYYKPIFKFSYILLDYDKGYNCIDSLNNNISSFADLKSCNVSDFKYRSRPLHERMVLLYVVLSISGVVIIAMILIVWKWWYVRYFLVMLKNTAMLSLLSDDGENPEKPYHYDVFVSYCNGDRDWVIDELLPQIEYDNNISVCLHERDFQVGLSILENIISCVDRSRAILLVVSKEFLLSQWCQFEMHLAQHRLLETRRERLILVLLEDIPRKQRPNTLHYLMMTKTYIIWPKGEHKEDVVTFWRRLKKALLNGKIHNTADV